MTPVINWWYWGDDISPRLVEEGGRDKAAYGTFVAGIQQERAGATTD